MSKRQNYHREETKKRRSQEPRRDIAGNAAGKWGTREGVVLRAECRTGNRYGETPETRCKIGEKHNLQFVGSCQMLHFGSPRRRRWHDTGGKKEVLANR